MEKSLIFSGMRNGIGEEYIRINTGMFDLEFFYSSQLIFPSQLSDEINQMAISCLKSITRIFIWNSLACTFQFSLMEFFWKA